MGLLWIWNSLAISIGAALNLRLDTLRAVAMQPRLITLLAGAMTLHLSLVMLVVATALRLNILRALAEALPLRSLRGVATKTAAAMKTVAGFKPQVCLDRSEYWTSGQARE